MSTTNEAIRRKLKVEHPGEVVTFNAPVMPETIAKLTEAVYLASEFCLSVDHLPPVKMFINSPGGDLEAAVLAYAALPVMCPTGLVTIGAGSVQSAATVLLLAGDRVLGTKDSHYLIHNTLIFPGGGADDLGNWKNTHDFTDMKTHCKYWDEAQMKIYSKHLTVPKNAIREIMDDNEVFPAKRAKSIGLIEEIL